MTEAIGFIGLGIMGLGMAENLVKSGKSLIVWNRSAEKAAAFCNAHPDAVSVVATAEEVVQRCNIVYSMLSTLEASSAVFPSILGALRPDSILVDCATLTPERMMEMEGQVKHHGARFIEAPVSGSKTPAANGDLIFLVAGSKVAFDAVEADFKAMGKATHFLGEAVGAATKMKLCVNMTMGAQLAALGEGIAMAEAAGLSSGTFVDILGQGALASKLVHVKGNGIINRSYETNFPLAHAQKDMRFAVQLGDQLGLALPVSAASNEAYKRARGMGLGDADFSAVFEAMRLPGAGVPPPVVEDEPAAATVPTEIADPTPEPVIEEAAEPVEAASRAQSGNRKNASSLGTGFYDPTPQRSSTRRIAPPGGSSTVIF